MSGNAGLIASAVEALQKAFKDAGISSDVTVVVVTAYQRADGGPSVEYGACGEKLLTLSMLDMAKHGLLNEVCGGAGTDGYRFHRE